MREHSGATDRSRTVSRALLDGDGLRRRAHGRHATGTARRVRCLLQRCLLNLTLGLTLAACGGAGSDTSTDAGTVLFDGPAAALVPHETGRSTMFQVTATNGSQSATSGFSATVLSNAADGSYVTEYVSQTGARLQTRSLDAGDEIRVVEVLSSSGGGEAGQDGRAADADGADPPQPIDPPAVVVRTPVVAGRGIETGFARAIDLTLEIAGQTLERQALFIGSARRTPKDRAAVTVPAGTFEAIRYAASASGRSTLTIAGRPIDVLVDVAGDEWFAPGVGGVREALDVHVAAGGAAADVRFVTERLGEGVPFASAAATPRFPLPRVPSPGLVRSRLSFHMIEIHDLVWM